MAAIISQAVDKKLQQLLGANTIWSCQRTSQLKAVCRLSSVGGFCPVHGFATWVGTPYTCAGRGRKRRLFEPNRGHCKVKTDDVKCMRFTVTLVQCLACEVTMKSAVRCIDIYIGNT